MISIWLHDSLSGGVCEKCYIIMEFPRPESGAPLAHYNYQISLWRRYLVTMHTSLCQQIHKICKLSWIKLRLKSGVIMTNVEWLWSGVMTMWMDQLEWLVEFSDRVRVWSGLLARTRTVISRTLVIHKDLGPVYDASQPVITVSNKLFHTVLLW